MVVGQVIGGRLKLRPGREICTDDESTEIGSGKGRVGCIVTGHAGTRPRSRPGTQPDVPCPCPAPSIQPTGIHTRLLGGLETGVGTSGLGGHVDDRVNGGETVVAREAGERIGPRLGLGQFQIRGRLVELVFARHHRAVPQRCGSGTIGPVRGMTVNTHLHIIVAEIVHAPRLATVGHGEIVTGVDDTAHSQGIGRVGEDVRGLAGGIPTIRVDHCHDHQGESHQPMSQVTSHAPPSGRTYRSGPHRSRGFDQIYGRG